MATLDDYKYGFGCARLKKEGTSFWLTSFMDVPLFPGDLESAGLHKTKGRWYPRKNREILGDFMELYALYEYIYVST